MRVVIVGSGLIGLTTAWFVASRGHEVIVIDRQEGPGRETSFANGAMLTPSMPEPWNAPGCWRVLLASIGRAKAPMQLRVKAIPSLIRWGTTFLKSSAPAAYERSLISNLRLALYSQSVMHSLREDVDSDCAWSSLGTLRVFRKRTSLETAVAGARWLSNEGLEFRQLSPSEAVELEPGLQPIGDLLAGAIYYRGDEVGDAHRFCAAIARRAKGRGVHFHFRASVSGLEVRGQRVTALRVNEERLKADRYIIAAGSYTSRLLKGVDVHVPVQPVKGYSVTFDDLEGPVPLRIPVIDDDLHAAVVPVGSALRIAGTAEFAGYDLTLRPDRISNLFSLLGRLLPDFAVNPAKAKPWCGLRPMSADGVPIIGVTCLDNLMVNTGHGPLGWTMAAGSGRLLADLLADENPGIDAAPFAPSRFLGC